MTTKLAGLLATAALLLVAVFAEGAAAATVGTARWHGTFDVTVTYVKDTLNPENEGKKVQRVNTITSSCDGTAACDTVRYKRVAGDGTAFIYRLKRIEPGTYKGSTSYESSWWCEEDGKRLYTWTGTMKEITTLVARTQSGGKVTKYAGTTRMLYPPYEINGSVPNRCKTYFAGQGLEEGDRPEIKLGLIGVLR